MKSAGRDQMRKVPCARTRRAGGASNASSDIPAPTGQDPRDHEAGASITRIAGELRLSRGTVGKYVRGFDEDVEVARSPVASMTADEVKRLRAIASTVVGGTCPNCGQGMVTLSTMTAGRCLACAAEWTRRVGKPARR